MSGSQAKGYRRDAKDQGYRRDAQGEGYRRDSQGKGCRKDAQGQGYSRDAQGEGCRRGGQGRAAGGCSGVELFRGRVTRARVREECSEAKVSRDQDAQMEGCLGVGMQKGSPGERGVGGMLTETSTGRVFGSWSAQREGMQGCMGNAGERDTGGVLRERDTQMEGCRRVFRWDPWGFNTGGIFRVKMQEGAGSKGYLWVRVHSGFSGTGMLREGVQEGCLRFGMQERYWKACLRVGM